MEKRSKGLNTGEAANQKKLEELLLEVAPELLNPNLDNVLFLV